MENKYDAGLLKDEYVMLQHFYEDIDEKGLNIKNWSITVALASIGAGIIYDRNILLISFFAALMFWILEAYWRGLSYFYVVRIKIIEKAFAEGRQETEIPLQVYATWSEAYKTAKNQTFNYMKKFSSLLPHVAIMIISLILFLIKVFVAP